MNKLIECTSSVNCVGYQCVRKTEDGFKVCPNLRISSVVDDEKRG